MMMNNHSAEVAEHLIGPPEGRLAINREREQESEFHSNR